MVTVNTDHSTTQSPTRLDTSVAVESVRILTRYLTAETLPSCRIELECGGPTHEQVAIPEAAVRLLARILEEMAKGNSVTVMATETELTTQQAADVLNVSRPFLIQQLEKGLISYHKVGSHKRVRLHDILQYKQSMDQKRYDALDQLSAMDQTLGFGY